MKTKILTKSSTLKSNGYLAINCDTMEHKEIKNLVMRFGIEKFKLNITQANESMEFLSRLFLRNRNKDEILVKKDHCVTYLSNFKAKVNKYTNLSYRCNCSFMFEYEYEGIIENSQCSISLRDTNNKKYVVFLSTHNNDYSNSVDGHLLIFNDLNMHSLFDSIKPMIEFDIFSENEKIGWGYFQSGLLKVMNGIKL